MAKPSQTFKKRQREMKLREKAQLKFQRRLQRGQEKSQAASTATAGDQPESSPAHEFGQHPFEASTDL